MSWPLVKLSDVAEINPRLKSAIETDTVPFVSMSDIFDEGGGFNYEVRPTAEVRKGYAHFQNKDVLIAKITPCFENGKSVLIDGLPHMLGFGSTEFHIIRAHTEVLDPKYVFYSVWNSRFREHASLSMQGSAGQKRLPTDYIKEFEIPLPPLSEQKRITEILDCADALRRTRRETIKSCDDLLRSTFLETFGDPVTNPMGWEVRELGEVATITTGNTPSRKESDYYGDHVEWIKTNNIQSHSILASTATEYLSKKGAQVGRVVQRGSVLMACIAGSISSIGKVAIVNREVAFNQQINAITPSDIFTTEYLYAMLKLSQPLIQDASTGGMKGMVSKSTLSRLRFIVPQIEKQRAFTHVFKQIVKLKEFMMTNNDQEDTLFNSLVQRAFRGEL